VSEIFWLEQREEDVRGENDWFSVGELSVLNRLVFLKRRTEWRLGRWTAKCAFAAFHEMPPSPQILAQIEIRPAPSGAPEVFLCDQPAPVNISISHRSGKAICSIGSGNLKLGCDLETIEPHTDAFVEDYFTCDEQLLLARSTPTNRPLLATLLWSAKESALKALQVGLRADTRSVIVELSQTQLTAWGPVKISCSQSDFHGWWCEEGGLVRTIVSAPASAEPIALQRG
jgi:4'-phosphopantetheinyl transferase